MTHLNSMGGFGDMVTDTFLVPHGPRGGVRPQQADGVKAPYLGVQCANGFAADPTTGLCLPVVEAPGGAQTINGEDWALDANGTVQAKCVQVQSAQPDGTMQTTCSGYQCPDGYDIDSAGRSCCPNGQPYDPNTMACTPPPAGVPPAPPVATSEFPWGKVAVIGGLLGVLFLAMKHRKGVGVSGLASHDPDTLQRKLQRAGAVKHYEVVVGRDMRDYAHNPEVLRKESFADYRKAVSEAHRMARTTRYADWVVIYARDYAGHLYRVADYEWQMGGPGRRHSVKLVKLARTAIKRSGVSGISGRRHRGLDGFSVGTYNSAGRLSDWQDFSSEQSAVEYAKNLAARYGSKAVVASDGKVIKTLE